MGTRRITFVNQGARGHWPGVPGEYAHGDLVDLFYDDELGIGRQATAEERAALADQSPVTERQEPAANDAAPKVVKSRRVPADDGADAPKGE